MPLAANNPTDRVEQLIALTQRLTGLIERETEFLKNRRPREITEFHDERAKLSTIYAQEMTLIASQRSLIEGVKAELLDQLKMLTGYFQEKLNEHGRVLSRVRSVTEGMIRAVAEEVSHMKNPQSGYGALANAKTPAMTIPTTLTLNEVI